MVMASFKKIALLGLASLLAEATALVAVSINDCSDLTSVTDALEGDDVTATFANDLTCEDAWTTITVPTDRQLTVEAEDSTRRVKFTNVRFKVEERDDIGEYDLIFTPNVKFFSTIEADSDPELAIQDVNGGVLEVLSGAAVHFEGYSRNIGIEIISARVDDTDFSDHVVNGGAWYNEGRIKIDGGAKFKRCDNTGGGESFPGSGGAVFNGEFGKIDFLGGAEFKTNRCIDDQGGEGGGIYNAGTIVVSPSAVFSNNIAEQGGGIFNVDTGSISFETDDTVSFYNNEFGSDSDSGGNIFNTGSISFGSFVKFLKGEDGIDTNGHIAFMAGGLFKNLPEGAMRAGSDATFEGLDDLEFKNNGEASGGCPDISMFRDGEYVCLP